MIGVMKYEMIQIVRMKSYLVGLVITLFVCLLPRQHPDSAYTFFKYFVDLFFSTSLCLFCVYGVISAVCAARDFKNNSIDILFATRIKYLNHYLGKLFAIIITSLFTHLLVTLPPFLFKVFALIPFDLRLASGIIKSFLLFYLLFVIYPISACILGYCICLLCKRSYIGITAVFGYLLCSFYVLFQSKPSSIILSINNSYVHGAFKFIENRMSEWTGQYQYAQQSAVTYSQALASLGLMLLFLILLIISSYIKSKRKLEIDN